ncbi:type II toxin-antitoxin system VapC family toxin [Methylocaldum sp. 14B]|uniref:type II toxin-antitoxin system VapC family toxin n=1 Tax=unclassified Methylocaldum TaxID=2622260 RepID=UPI00098AB4A3|nr:type II toxin-antitoxin system VapC family toxin [Methylocaldum sp. 14B]MBP1149441.1 PIN domain nuclease of toxin-antitoxin system [Methylocaldum sp. RMAD-M]
MRLLLDTHVLLWVLADDAALSNTARAEIDRAEAVYASAASIWEISIKSALGKLKIDQRCLPDRLIEAGFLPLPVTWEHANAVRKLPNLHRDPFDRILIAQAITEPLRFMTADRALAGYSELVVLI